MGGMGMLIVGLVTAPQMGHIADRFVQQQLEAHRAQTIVVLEKVVAQYPPLAEKSPFHSEIMGAVAEAQTVLTAARGGALPGTTADALRSAVKNAPPGADAIVTDIRGILSPADNYGGRMSFRYVAPFSIVIILVFGILYLRDRAGGGYKAEKLTGGDKGAPAPA
jgi:hypothetical protein